jgi:hypothetical protein
MVDVGFNSRPRMLRVGFDSRTWAVDVALLMAGAPAAIVIMAPYGSTELSWEGVALSEVDARET